MAHDELELVDWLRRRQPAHPAVVLGIGDDMAMLASSSGPLLVSCDLLLDGVHFDSGKHSPGQIGRKAIARSLSDCAAMAVRPVAATVAVALPSAMARADIEAMYEGIWEIAGKYNLAVVGGDTARWNHPLAIDVAITAEPYGGVRPVTRSGARPGDLLYVTGPLGGSLWGHHLAFTPRVAEAHILAEKLSDRLHAMIDVSDGLALDLWRICEASSVGATLEEGRLRVVVSDDARRCAQADGRAEGEHVLGDGEDYELLLAVDGEAVCESVPLYPVGYVTASGLELIRADGRIEPLTPMGYVH